MANESADQDIMTADYISNAALSCFNTRELVESTLMSSKIKVTVLALISINDIKIVTTF
jgi:hypothetical protein